MPNKPLMKGGVGDDVAICLGGRGAAPPEYRGGPTGYRLILKRQTGGKSMCTPAQIEAVIGIISASDPDVPTSTWDLLRRTLDEGMTSIDKRLEQYGRLDPGWLQPQPRPTSAWRSSLSEEGSAYEIPRESDLPRSV